MRSTFALESVAAAEGFGLEPLDDDQVRDPRTDPHPGDVLVVDDDVREITGRFYNSHVAYKRPADPFTNWLALIDWQRWARDADVRRAAMREDQR